LTVFAEPSIRSARELDDHVSAPAFQRGRQRETEPIDPLEGTQEARSSADVVSPAGRWTRATTEPRAKPANHRQKLVSFDGQLRKAPSQYAQRPRAQRLLVGSMVLFRVRPAPSRGAEQRVVPPGFAEDGPPSGGQDSMQFVGRPLQVQVMQDRVSPDSIERPI